ncbi:hypothetical protein CLV24_12451 [Pontibacter ummariensis]|uniref:Uncharacterized protein n=2 Tax=Pontibacter ummariensis TaxID=1610492 RepID=A0A239JVS6_9BACT|nr:hypothetical protein CLV24_12451 [Pontibacter ummariensis]SNT09860.1 hypothetical protein SAMN06296052_12413 [Pontibacter ummariensis]
MEDLHRLVRLVTHYSSKSQPLLNLQDESNLDTKFFNLIKSGAVKSDEDAALELYGQRDRAANYRMLKSRLRKKLLSHLHFLKLPEGKFRATSINKYQCSSLLLEAQSLIVLNEIRMANKVLDQALALAKQNELNDQVVKILEQKQWVNLILGNKKKHEETRLELEKFYKIEKAEREAIHIFQSVSVVLKDKFTARSTSLQKYPAILARMKELWEISNSSLVFNYYHILLIQYHEFTGDYNAVIGSVTAAESLLTEGKVHTSWFNHAFNSFIKAYALLQTKQYEQGLNFVEQRLKHFEPYSMSWFPFMENYFLLAVHAKSYQLALNIIEKSLQDKHILKIANGDKERWELYRRYLLLLQKRERLGNDFKYTETVVSELVLLPKDKEGFNLSLLVLDAIELLSNPNLDDYEPLAERIRKYISKYLRGEKAERGRLFLRMLLLVIKEGLDPAQSREKGERLLEKLSVALPPGDAFAEVEIVPYEQLWELVLWVLCQRKGRK